MMAQLPAGKDATITSGDWTGKYILFVCDWGYLTSRHLFYQQVWGWELMVSRGMLRLVVF
jgi:hypothetical protein